ncbi:MAG: polyamine aminopropyltransferase [Polyangiaceae bacterium]
MASASSSPQPSAAESPKDRPPRLSPSPPLPPAWRPPTQGARPGALLGMVLVIATAGLVYELCIAAVASYLLGDSVRQFSLIIGVYLSALGAGAYLSSFIDRRLELRFIDVELATALVGGFSAPLLFVAHATAPGFRVVLFATVICVGILVGLELPLLMRILKGKLEFKALVARALTFDYAGALIGSVGFSMVLLPMLGLSRASLVCGLLNALVGLASTWVLRGTDDPRSMVGARTRAVVITLLLALGLLQAERLQDFAESQLYSGPVLHREQTPYQRIVLAQRGEHFQLFLNGNLQFSSDDEHRYHEALVHPAMQTSRARRSVLIGGGGDGLAAREVLKWPEVERVTLVDLDPAMTTLAATDARLAGANARALSDPRVQVVNDDAFLRFAGLTPGYDVIILDFPDPSNFALGKLYSVEMYRRVRRLLAAEGSLVVQATSPRFARRSFWCVAASIQQAGFTTLPYHIFVPSFGDWGFVLAKLGAIEPPRTAPPVRVRFLDAAALADAFVFPRDSAPLTVADNRLQTQALVGYYLDEWERWN